MEPADGACRGLQGSTGPARARPGLKAQAPPISVECRDGTPEKRKNTSDAPYSPPRPPQVHLLEAQMLGEKCRW